MDLTKIFDLLLMANIDNDKIMTLINEASSMDLSVEDNQRELIQKGCKIANKEIDKNTEDKIIAILKEKGISKDLFNIV